MSIRRPFVPPSWANHIVILKRDDAHAASFAHLISTASKR